MTTMLSAIRDYCVDHKMPETAFGRAAVNDPKFVGELRRGRNCTTKMLDRVETFLRGDPAKPTASQPVPSPAPAPADKPKISAAVIRAAKLDGRDLPTFVTALIDMGLECWRDDRREHGEPVA